MQASLLDMTTEIDYLLTTLDRSALWHLAQSYTGTAHKYERIERWAGLFLGVTYGVIRLGKLYRFEGYKSFAAWRAASGYKIRAASTLSERIQVIDRYVYQYGMGVVKSAEGELFSNKQEVLLYSLRWFNEHGAWPAPPVLDSVDELLYAMSNERLYELLAHHQTRAEAEEQLRKAASLSRSDFRTWLGETTEQVLPEETEDNDDEEDGASKGWQFQKPVRLVVKGVEARAAVEQYLRALDANATYIFEITPFNLGEVTDGNKGNRVLSDTP